MTDKIGLQKCDILLVGLSTLGIVLLNFSTVGAIAILSSFLFGFAMAAPFVLAPLLTTFAFGAKDFADIYGTVTIFTFLGPILMPTLSGMIYDPVSYTHLDVYKRQVHASVTGSERAER